MRGHRPAAHEAQLAAAARPQESGQQSGRAQHRPGLLVVVALQAAAAHSGASGTEGGATGTAPICPWLGHSHCAWRRFQHHDGAPEMEQDDALLARACERGEATADDDGAIHVPPSYAQAWAEEGIGAGRSRGRSSDTSTRTLTRGGTLSSGATSPCSDIHPDQATEPAVGSRWRRQTVCGRAVLRLSQVEPGPAAARRQLTVETHEEFCLTSSSSARRRRASSSAGCRGGTLSCTRGRRRRRRQNRESSCPSQRSSEL